jgi:ATP-dependent DNA helicase RecG
MSPESAKSDIGSLLKNYELMDNKGLRISGAVLFSKTPWLASRAVPVKIGAFSEDGTILRDDVIECPVIMQPDQVMDLLLKKYVQGTNVVEGLMMVARYPYPVRALREAVLNSIAHRDYSRVVETYIRVYPDRVEISNPGSLPNGWTKDDLYKRHDSEPANPAIARAFFAAGYIEKFGSGIGMIRKECAMMGIPEPEYVVDMRRVEIIFRSREKKDSTASNDATAEVLDMTDTESKIYALILAGKGSKIAEMSEASDIPSRTVSRILERLVNKGHIQRIGGDRHGKWIHIPKSK